MRFGPRMSDTSPRVGPTPFSAEWIDDPPAPERPRRLPLRQGWLPATLPPWLPSERVLTTALVLIIVLTTTAFASAGGGQRQLPALAAPTEDTALVSTQPPAATGDTPATEAAAVTTGDDTTGTTDVAATTGGSGDGTSGVSGTTETPESSPDPSDAAVADGAADETGTEADDVDATTGTDGTTDESTDEDAAGSGGAGLAGDQEPVVVPPHDEDSTGLLPDNRIVAVYGFPTDANMGVLGEYGIEDIQGLYDEVLMPLVEQWEAADPSRPVVPAFEVIFGVAQENPQSDGSYLAHGSMDDVQLYIDFAAEHDMVVLVDTQMGMRTIEEEVDYMMPLLEQPNVHLAIDPEFAIAEGEEPGVHIGQMDASDINWAQEQMADLAAEQGLPEKIVMVHQFHYTMIENKENIVDVPGVELIIHADGHGDPASKEVTYEVMVTQWIEEIPFFAGFKVWLNNDTGFGDEPRMEPEDIILLNPAPDIITYQ